MFFSVWSQKKLWFFAFYVNSFGFLLSFWDFIWLYFYAPCIWFWGLFCSHNVSECVCHKKEKKDDFLLFLHLFTSFSRHREKSPYQLFIFLTSEEKKCRQKKEKKTKNKNKRTFFVNFEPCCSIKEISHSWFCNQKPLATLVFVLVLSDGLQPHINLGEPMKPNTILTFKTKLNFN